MPVEGSQEGTDAAYGHCRGVGLTSPRGRCGETDDRGSRALAATRAGLERDWLASRGKDRTLISTVVCKSSEQRTGLAA